MAVKSVIDIELNDGNFKQFAELFEKYQAQLAKTPAAWAAVSKENKAVNDSFQRMTAALLAQGELTRLNAKALKEQENSAKDAASSWERMQRSTKNVAGNIADATISLVKWTGIISAVTGLLGAGGIYGIDRLASSVSTTRRSSLGLGTSYGEQQAFGLVYGRLVDTGSFLGGVSDALADPRKRLALNALGLTGKELQGDTAQVGQATLEHLRAFAKRTPEQYLGTYADAYHLGDLGVGVEDLRRLRNTSDEEFNGLKSKYGQAVGQIGLGDETQRKWQDFTTQLGIAGEKIKTVFIDGLTTLVPELTKLSDAFADVVRDLVGSQGFKDLIGSLATGLKEFAAYVGTDDFKENVKTFAQGVESLAKGVVTGLKWIGLIPGDAAPPDVDENGNPRHGILQQPKFPKKPDVDSSGRAHHGLLEHDSANDNDDVLDTIRRLEGSSNDAVSPKGAVGAYQILPSTAQQYGLDPSRLKDASYSRYAASIILADLKKRYHGNVAEELIAYNAGPGVADKFDAAGGGTGAYASLPAETRRYLATAGGMRNDVNIYLYNKTGGDVTASTSALAR